MGETQILSDAAAAMVDQPITFSVGIVERSWLDNLLMNWGLKKSKRDFKLTGIKLGTMLKISKEMLKINIQTGNDIGYLLIQEHTYTIAKVVALGIVNRKKNPSEKLITFLIDNLSNSELKNLIDMVLLKLDVINFIHTIIAAKSMAVMNPRETDSIIPSGEQSVV